LTSIFLTVIMLKEYIRFQNMKNIDVVEKLKATVNRFGLLEKGERVLVALSGGPDSVALLYGLLNLKPEYRLELYVAHLNHKLRGVESDEDEKFAKKLASGLKLKFFSKKVDVRREAKKRKLSIEETAREVRYRYLERLADRVGANKIALGHQADDQAETFLMRLVRGAGAAGLSGMPVRRDKIIRPLIQIKRKEIERFLEINQIPFRLDSSNYLTDFNRNKIRLKLLPVIKKEFNPRIVDSLNRAADIISLQQGYVQKISEQILKRIGKKRKGKVVIDAKRFVRLDTCLQREIIRICINDLGGDISQLSFELVDRTLNLTGKRRSGKRIKLDKSVWFEVGSSELALFLEEEKEYSCSIKLPGKSVLKDRNLMIESKLLNGRSQRENLFEYNQNVSFLDWEKLTPPFVLRSRKKGDRFKPLGMKGTKSIADFLIDAKVSRHWREDVPVLTSKGRIVWLVGHRISDEFKVTGKTKKVLRLEAITLDSKKQ
jgi:tRNA(Ile)-lysidine synthase